LLKLAYFLKNKELSDILKINPKSGNNRKGGDLFNVKIA